MRRLVTTDSFDLPVPAKVMPSYVSALGGRISDTGIASELGADDECQRHGGRSDAKLGAGTDDFEAVTGPPDAQANILDLLRYRRVPGLPEVHADQVSCRTADAHMSQLNDALDPGMRTPTKNGRMGEPLRRRERQLEYGILARSYTDKNGNGVYDPPRLMDIARRRK